MLRLLDRVAIGRIVRGGSVDIDVLALGLLGLELAVDGAGRDAEELRGEALVALGMVPMGKLSTRAPAAPLGPSAAACEASRTSRGRSSSPIEVERVSTTARSMAFSSSRTLPGQV